MTWVVEIYKSSDSTKVGSYSYDSWGKLLGIQTTSDPQGILQKNPFRYRGYYYDTETGWYYLQSRYYDPEVKRFVNADSAVSTGEHIHMHNTYAYCYNNPINMSDEGGHWPTWDQVGKFLGGAAIIAIGVAAVVAAGPVVMAAAASVSLASAVSATTIVAAGGVAAGTTAVVCGASKINEAISGSNPVANVIGPGNYEVLTAASTFGSGATVSAFASSPLTPSSSNTNIDLNNINYSKTAAAHADRPYMNSPHTINNIIASSPPATDPSLAYGMRWSAPGAYGSTPGFYELVYDPTTQQFVHFMFKS